MMSMIVPQAPADVRDTTLWEVFRAASPPGLLASVDLVVSTCSPLLDLVVAGPFRDFTLHDAAHATKLVHLVGQFLPEETLKRLSALEAAVIIDACFLHDLGMAVTSKEREELLQSGDLAESVRSWPQLEEQLHEVEQKLAAATASERLGLTLRVFQLQEAALANLLRTRHATADRYRQMVESLKSSTGRRDLFEIEGVSFEKELIDICVSHNLDPACLLETAGPYDDRFKRDLALGGHGLNTQFCAGVLRLVDILDLDRERTPKILFESIGIGDSLLPGSTVSLREWNKHMAVHSLSVGENEIVVAADSVHPAIERSIREFCQVIERELRDTVAILRRNRREIVEHYRIDLPVTVRAQVRSQGYIYRDLAFRLDESSISRLLMGESLYSTPAVAIRELVQNAIDACRVRQLIDGATYAPAITVRESIDQDGRSWIEVTDNGTGMDDSVLSNYFFSVGQSYYSSAEFVRTIGARRFAPISRFGIGVMSVFILADSLEVTTRAAHSPRNDSTCRTVRIDGRFGLAFVTESPDGPTGTTVRIRLRRDLPPADSLNQLAAFVVSTVCRPAVPVDVRLGDVTKVLRPDAFVALRQNAAEAASRLGVEAVVIDLDRWSLRVRGRAVLFFYPSPNGLLLSPKTSPRMDEGVIQALVSDYGGNRLTVNGISMSLKKIGRVFGVKTGRMSGVVDVDLIGDDSVKYDVARTRLVDKSMPQARNEVRRAILLGLKELGVLDRMAPEARRSVEYQEPPTGRTASDVNYKKAELRFNKTVLVEAERILAEVQALLPTTVWPAGVHHAVAEEVGVRPIVVSAAIALLLEREIVRNPNPSPHGSQTSRNPTPPD